MDEVDRKIITQLQLNGRTSFEDLAKTVGYTGVGAKKRADKLLKDGIIKVTAALDIRELGLLLAFVLLEMESAETVNRLLERFSKCPRVVHIFTTLGGYNIVALVVAEDKSTLESISIEKCSLRSSEGIRRSELYPIGEVHYSPLLLVREYLTHREKTIAPCNVDCRSCDRYKSEECVGCPATEYYRGHL